MVDGEQLVSNGVDHSIWKVVYPTQSRSIHVLDTTKSVLATFSPPLSLYTYTEREIEGGLSKSKGKHPYPGYYKKVS